MSQKKPQPEPEQSQKPDYLASFIINAGKVSFTTLDGRKWQMRQPRPEEAADGDSAYRIAYDRAMNDARLLSVADGNIEMLKREARRRGSGAEAAYMIPMLLEDERGNVVYDIYSTESMADYEANPGLVSEMTMIYFGPLMEAIDSAKKK